VTIAAEAATDGIYVGSEGPSVVKLHGSVLHAMSPCPIGSGRRCCLPLHLTSAACIARKVIPALDPLFAACNTVSQ
jgi:hypothetical protein